MFELKNDQKSWEMKRIPKNFRFSSMLRVFGQLIALSNAGFQVQSFILNSTQNASPYLKCDLIASSKYFFFIKSK